MRIIRSVSTCVVLILFCFVFPLTARADMIYDPVGDFVATYGGRIIAIGLVLLVVAVTALLLWLLKRKK